MNEPNNVKPEACKASPALTGLETMLRCDHVSWGMNTILMTPLVAALCACAVEYLPARFLAGCFVGVWVSMWQIVLWAWLSRRKSLNDKIQP